ncbi:hypothetical protein RB195_004363 [Necator americanus]|uniref:Reverse transcriptase domain-containing protein n=1 Tax=Necator americanus TaxID=51031 RepID=A0ABR1BHS6_NECAM
MRKLEWDDMGVKVDGRQLNHLRFADDILLITPSISETERILTEFDETRRCIGLQLNLQKMFMRLKNQLHRASQTVFIFNGILARRELRVPRVDCTSSRDVLLVNLLQTSIDIRTFLAR